MPDTVKLLVAGPDPNLRAELADALGGLPDLTAVTHHADRPAAAAEAARSLQPDLILLEPPADPKALREQVTELQSAAPAAAVVAAFRPERFGQDVSEAAFFVEAVRAGVRDFLRRPLSTADLAQLVARTRTGTAPRRPPGKVVTFASNKGGVGKSTLSTSAACLLGRRFPGRVLLVDASLQMGVGAVLLNLRPETTLTDAVREKDRLDESLIRQLAAPHACGLHLLAAPADAEEAAGVDDQSLSRVLTVARRAYDFVVVDTFPLLDRVILAALDLSDRVYLVVESVVPTVLGAVKLVQVLDRLGYPAARQRVVVNRYESGFGGLRPADVAARLGRAVDFVVPHARQVVTAANLGEPYALRAWRWWGFGKAVGRVAADVESLAAAGRESP